MTDDVTDLEKLRTQRVRGVRSEYEFETADDADVADVCASYTWDGFTVMMILLSLIHISEPTRPY